MKVRHTVEKPDGAVVFQGVLEGGELAYVIELGLDALIASGGGIFLHGDSHNMADVHDTPDMEQ